MKILFKTAYKITLYLFVIWLLGFGLYYIKLPSLDTLDTGDKADAIVVLTGGAGRLEYALKILKSERASRMLISGVNPLVQSKELQQLTGADKELFDCCIELDYKADDTVGNVLQTKEWAERHNIKSFILVTADYHMPRSMILFKEQITDITITPAPVTTDAKITYFIREYNKYLFTLLRSGRTLHKETAKPQDTK